MQTSRELSVLAFHVFTELSPFKVEERPKLCLFFCCNRCEFERVQTELLEVGQIKLPGEESVNKVKHNTLIVEESWVIWADRNRDALVKKSSHWVTSEVENIAQDQVTHRAAFNTNLLLFDELLKMRVKREIEPMPDSLRTKKNRIIQVFIVGIH